MVFGKSQKEFTFRARVLLFFFLPPRSPSFLHSSKISVSYLFSSDQEIQNPCSTPHHPQTKPARLHPQSVPGRVEGHLPRAAWSPWFRLGWTSKRGSSRRQAARTRGTMNRLQPSLKKSLSISVSPALDLTSLCWLCLEARHQEPLMLHLYPHSVKEDTGPLALVNFQGPLCFPQWKSEINLIWVTLDHFTWETAHGQQLLF